MDGTGGILVGGNSATRYPYLEIELPSSEDFLLEQAVKRDRTAFTTLYDLHIDRVYKYVFYWLPNQADAEDITQEVFVRAWRSIDKYKISSSPFIAWLITIARNLVNSHYRASKRLVPLDDMDPPSKSNPEIETEMNFTRSSVKDAIMHLKGDKQSVIQMRFISEMSYEEIAKALNKTEGAIRVVQYRALKDLKGLLENTGR